MKQHLKQLRHIQSRAAQIAARAECASCQQLGQLFMELLDFNEHHALTTRKNDFDCDQAEVRLQQIEDHIKG